MIEQVKDVFESALLKYSFLNGLRKELLQAYESLYTCFREGNKLLVCGNGGSASDADHIVGELVKGFEMKRTLPFNQKTCIRKNMGQMQDFSGRLQMGLPVINLSAHASLGTAISNDLGSDLLFAQQVIGYGKSGDVLMGISTSGNAENLLKAGVVAKTMQMKTIALSGRDGGAMKDYFDINIIVHNKNTAEIQEMHTVLYHVLCRMIENSFWEE